jgi:hypothetical protein
MCKGRLLQELICRKSLKMARYWLSKLNLATSNCQTCRGNDFQLDIATDVFFLAIPSEIGIDIPNSAALDTKRR